MLNNGSYNYWLSKRGNEKIIDKRFIKQELFIYTDNLTSWKNLTEKIFQPNKKTFDWPKKYLQSNDQNLKKKISMDPKYIYF